MTRALLFATIAALPLAASAAPSARQRIAVLDIRAVQGVSPGTATILTAIVVDDSARAGYDVISQADVSAMIGFEKQKQMLGCAEDSSCLAEIGGALGVEFVLSGQVGQIGTRFHLSFQLLDAKKAKVVSRTARFSDRDEDRLAEAAQRSVGELLAAARPQRAAVEPPPPAKIPAVTSAPPPPPKPDLAARPPLPPPASPLAPERARGWRPSRTMAWVAMGGGAALMLGGAVFGLQANTKRDELERAWNQPDYQALYDTKSKDAKSLALVSTMLWISGGAAATAGGVMYYLGRPAPLAVAPAVGDGHVGLVASGAF